MTRRSAIAVGLGLLGCVALLAGEKAGPAPTTAPTTAPAKKPNPGAAAAIKAKGSYCLGLVLGRDLKKQKLRVEMDRFLKGIRDGMVGTEVKMTDEDIAKAIAAFQTQHLTRLAEENLKKSRAFLARTRKIDGVKVTASGLQYMVLRAGYGQRPKITDTVTVHYRAMLIDGTVFDSSYARGKPEAFAVAEVIPGWSEGLQLLKEGAKWKFFIPAKLAYGKDGLEEAVGPNAAIVIEVELVSIR